MHYHDGSPVALGDIVYVPVPAGTALARVVAIGATGEHLEQGPELARYLASADASSPDVVVLEWLGDDPFAGDPALSGKYATTDLDEWVVRSAEPMLVDCGEHGPRASAIVCRHLLDDPPRAGFVENSDDPNDRQAWCHACEALYEAEGDKTEAFRAFNDFVVVCVDCYHRCRSRHSVGTH